jgi:hypothetical protein
VSVHQLVLYVSGASDLSSHAIEGAKAFCEAMLPGRYELVVLDLEGHVSRANDDGVLATPTLILTGPSPRRRYVGDLSKIDRVAAALGLGLAAPLLDARSGR